MVKKNVKVTNQLKSETIQASTNQKGITMATMWVRDLHTRLT